MKKIIIFIMMLLIASTAFAFSFNFKLFNSNRGIKDYVGYKAWDDGTFAKSCNDYKNNSKVNLRYLGSVGDGLYRIKPDAGSPFDAYCDMTSDNFGWTLLMAGGMTANYTNPPASIYNGTSTENYSFTVLNTVTMNQSQLMAVISRMPFQDIRMTGYLMSSTNSTTTFAQKYNNLTGWSSSSCTIVASTSTINATEYGWNLAHQGSFTYVAATLGCLVAAGTPNNNMANIDYGYIGLGAYATSNPACTPQGGYYAACGARYLVGYANHRQTQSFHSTAAMGSKSNLVWIK
jgi:hypothetical protein